MSGRDNRTIAQVHAKARQHFNSLSKEEKIARLKAYGILNAAGRLAEAYGGRSRASGRPTSGKY